MSRDKIRVWEEKFSDNFQPNFYERLIKRFEKPRSRVINSLVPAGGGVLLDLACRNGDLLLSLSDRFTKNIGIDIAKNRNHFEAWEMGEPSIILITHRFENFFQ